MLDPILEQTKKAGWFFPESTWHCLSGDEKNFVKYEFTQQRTFEYYQKRLELINFYNKENVLDAACGMGQWSLALATKNKLVTGVDINSARLLTAKSLADNHQLTNCSFIYSPLEQLPFQASSFDAIFCYGAFMFTEMDKCLTEFHRLLAPNGLIYLNANTLGWYAHLLLDRGIKKKNWSLIKTVIKMGLRTLFHKKSNIILTRQWLEKSLVQSGFKVLAIGTEGTLNLTSDSSIHVESAYPSTYYGLESILEVVFIKEAV